MNPRATRPIASVAAVSALACLLLSVVLSGVSGTASAAEDPSATKSGSGRFSGLKVTVSQVEHLRNAVVRVSWSGGQPSATSDRNYLSNYLQIMQCWGDEKAPQREKCQYGGIFDDQRGGQATSNREIVNNGQLDDPAETYTAPFPATAVVPFTSVTGKTVTSRRNEFFDSQSTNEIDYGRTSADGTGEEFFEVQTAREAPGLGCGAQLSNGDTRDCWLVVVPRDDKEVNGKDVGQLETKRLESSPLSASNFAQAISFRLDFDPVGVTCPIGSSERRLLGNESAAEAISRWQPKLCDRTGAIFGYSQLGDDSARRQTLTDDPWVSMVNRPLDASLNQDNRSLVYAPVAINAVGIGVVIERVPKDGSGSTAEEKSLRGTRVLNLNLNARLVAKLLTQSYTAAVTGDTAHVAGNPRWLTEDKEFLRLNPEFDQLQYIGQLYSITNPLGLSDANRSLWEWIKSDPDASAFIAGSPDPDGMKVNSFYRGMSLDLQDFPRLDSTCITFPESAAQADLCALDHLAYAADFHAATRAAIRGVTLASDTWDPNPPQRYKQNPAQTPGGRAVLVVTDTATAARYKVGMARLQNASGAFVSPTETAMRAAVVAMKDSAVAGVLAPDPATKVSDAYPLTEVTYAMTAPRQLDKDEATDYAGFVRYVAGDEGQTPGAAPGQLPDGYLPLTTPLRVQAADVANVIAKQGGPLPAAEPSPGATADAPAPVVVPPNSPVAALPVVAPAPEPAPAVAGTTDDTLLAASTTTAIGPGPGRFALLLALVLGTVAVATRPAAYAWALAHQRLRAKPYERLH